MLFFCFLILKYRFLLYNCINWAVFIFTSSLNKLRKACTLKKKKKKIHIAGASEFVCLWEREWRTKGPMNCLNYMHRMEERDLIAILKTPIIRYSLIFRTFFFTFPAIHWFVCWKHQRLVWNQLETKLIYTVLLHSSHL